MNLLQSVLSIKNKKEFKKGKFLVNILIPKSGWILTKIGENAAKNCKVNGVVMKTSHKTDANADVNFYCDIQNTFFGEKTKLNIGYMTHAHKNSKKWLLKLLNERNGFKNLDGIVLMNSRYRKLCEQVGFPKEKITTIIPGQTYDRFTLRKITIGIVSRGGYPGYGQNFMEELFTKYDLSGFKYRFLGKGWENILPIAKKKNIAVELLSDSDYSIYPKFYHEIDYLLIPGLWTAGPMSFQESLASGIPVISADVGFAGYEFQPDFIFPSGDTKILYKILQKIRKPMINRRKQIEGMSWENYAKQLIGFFKKMEILKKSQRI